MCDKTNKADQAWWVSVDSDDDILLTRNMMRTGISQPEYTRLDNIKDRMKRLDE